MSTFEDVLAQCLADIEAGRTTIEECLSRFPEQAPELQPLLRTAAAVRHAPAIEPSAAFQEAAGTRLLNLIAARQQSPATLPAPARRWGLVLVRVAAVVCLLSLVCGGTAYAARDSMPDSPLYPVKRTVEQVQATLAPNAVRKARAFVDQLDRRALEAATMIKRGKVERALQTSGVYIVTLRQAEAAAQRVPADRPEGRAFLIYMRLRLTTHREAFQNLAVSAPDRVRIARPVLNNIERALDAINTRLQSQ